VIRLRDEGLFWRESGDEVVALDAEVSRYFAVNPSATVLWKRLGDGASEEELADALCERYGIERDLAEREVKAFLEVLSARGLLER